MSSLPECKRCGVYVHGGPCYCERCGSIENVVQLQDEIASLRSRLEHRERLLWSPINERFMEGVMREAGHQVARWGEDHDFGKEPEDWLFLIGYLAGKACKASREGNQEKALHHTISTAAVCANWHAHIKGEETTFRPGHGPEKSSELDSEGGGDE